MLGSLLEQSMDLKASDLHLKAGELPYVRINGVLQPLNDSPLNEKELNTSCLELLNEEQKEVLKQRLELDFMLEKKGRFRGNYFFCASKLCAVFRLLPSEIPSLDELKCPEIFKQLIHKEKGLILVTGATGSGKSTTLAALLNEINEKYNKHIVSLEDPVEFVHKNKQSIFTQRSLNQDTKSYKNAIKSALRQDLDVLFIGEMRDEETMQAALEAAETGHLVFSTLHTNGASSTLYRILNSFEGSRQEQIKNMLSLSLSAIISQVLIPRQDKKDRLAIYELLINNKAVANLIRENKIHQIDTFIELNENVGMMSQKNSLKRAMAQNLISQKDALRYANLNLEMEL